MQQKTKILIVTDSIDVDDSSGSKANVALITNLHEAGFQLKVYHYTRKEIALEGISCVAVKEQKLTHWYILAKLQLFIQRIAGLNFNKRIENIRGFSFAFFNDSWSIKRALHKEKPDNYDWILTLSKAASFRPHKAVLELTPWHSKWLAYIHDPYPMHSYPRPYDWVEPGHQKKRDFFLQIAEACRYAVYPSKLLGEWMESYYPKLRSKGVLIPHQIDKNIKIKNKTPEYFNPTHFTILYAGALMSARKPQALVEAYRRLLNEYPESQQESQLLFIGEENSFTPFFNETKKEVPQLYSSDAYVPFEEVLAMQYKASVNVILEAKGSTSPFLPGKFPHCISAGRPILLLGPYYSESRRLLKSDNPFYCEIDDVQTISQHLVKLYLIWKNNPQGLQKNYEKIEFYLSKEYLKDLFNKI